MCRFFGLKGHIMGYGVDIRIIFWIAAVLIPVLMLYGSAMPTMQWEFISARIIVYLFVIALLGYLTWKNSVLEKRIEKLESKEKK